MCLCSMNICYSNSCSSSLGEGNNFQLQTRSDCFKFSNFIKKPNTLPELQFIDGFPWCYPKQLGLFLTTCMFWNGATRKRKNIVIEVTIRKGISSSFPAYRNQKTCSILFGSPFSTFFMSIILASRKDL